KTLAPGASHQQERTHAAGLTDAHGADIRLDELHGVVDRQAGGDRPAGTVDVEVDVLVRILRLQEQHLRHDQIGDLVIDLADQKDHPFLQQARVDVVGALAASSLLDDHRYQVEIRDGIHGHARGV